MTNRRVDSICFMLLVVGGLIALLAGMFSSSRSSDEMSGELEIPALSSDLELPSVALPDPWFAFRPVSTYKSPDVSRPRFGDEVESALVEVRSALLASAVPTELARAE